MAGSGIGGRVALVTGASSGLGGHFAEILAGAGARVVLGARRVSLLGEVRDRIERVGGEAMAVEMDVTDEASVLRAYEEAQAAYGTVDTVIANAGMNIEGPAIDLEAEAFGRVMAVNVTGVFLTIREGARRMMAADVGAGRGGRIVIISSITAQSVSPGLAAYSASKAAVLQLGRVLARDWVNRGLNLNILCPGYISTDLNAEWFASEGGRKQIGKWPRRRLMDGDALDGQLLYLAGDESRFVTGAVVTVDDGQSLS